MNSVNISENVVTQDNNIDEIVQPLYNDEAPQELIGYSCKQVLEQNTVEPMDLMFYMDILTPSNETQVDAVAQSQQAILQEMAKQYQIDPIISKGFRCFDLPVDGSTWLVQLSIDTQDFKEITLFGK